MNYILTNISYTGDMIWQKTFATDTIPFQQVRNHGEKPTYYVPESHPAIISKEDFQRVQTLMAMRRTRHTGETGAACQALFSKRIYCETCGSLFRKKLVRGKIYWVCRKHDSNKGRCPALPVPETEVTAATLRLYHKLKQNGEQLLVPLLNDLKELRERELRSNQKLGDIDREIAHISEQDHVLTRLKSKGYVDPALYLSQRDELEHKLKSLRRLRRRILESAGEDRQIRDTETMLDFLADSPDWLDDVIPDLFDSLIDRLIVTANGHMKFRLLNGLELTEHTERQAR